jgi:hypothetical protein
VRDLPQVAGSRADIARRRCGARPGDEPPSGGRDREVHRASQYLVRSTTVLLASIARRDLVVHRRLQIAIDRPAGHGVNDELG